MKRKLLSLGIAFLLVCCLTLPAFASAITYIYDELDVFYDYEETDLSALCEDIDKQYDIGVFYATVNGELDAFDTSLVVGDKADYIMFIENDDKWNVFYNGRAKDFVNQTEIDALYDVYDAEVSIKSAATQCIVATEKLISANVKSETWAEDTSSKAEAPIITGQEEGALRLLDDADLLSETEEATLLKKLNTASEKYKVDLVIATVESLEGATVENYAGLLYDSYGYGFGEKKDGVLLLVAMEERKWHILTNGLGNTAITDSEAESIGDAFSSYLTAKDYVNGFNVFIDKCEYQINGEINGFPFPLGRNLLIALAVGFILAFIVTGSWKSKLKSVRNQKNATVYTKEGSMNITVANDFYLYSTVTRKAKPEKSSSGSSGGSSRGGASGSF